MRRRFVQNPFAVLGVAPDAGRAEIEGAGQKLLAMLELGLDGAQAYATPFGEARRGADDVRRALAELRDPARRLEHELWARGPKSAPAGDAPAVRVAGWAGARARLGLGRR